MAELSDTQRLVLGMAARPQGFLYNGWDLRTVRSLCRLGFAVVTDPGVKCGTVKVTDAGRRAWERFR